VSAILIVMSLGISYIIGQYVAMPIIDLNESAKHLTTEEVEIGFEGKGYREIIELKETLNYAQAEITALDKYRKELISNISHDLRTPLALIKGYSELMRDLPGEATPENFAVVIGEIDRITNLVSDMLDLSKLNQSERTLNLEYFDIVEEMKVLYERHSKLLGNLGYILEFQADDEKAFVYADQVKILQVVYNLINNAVTYSGDDKLVILKETSTKDKVRIEVIDNGEGIDVDILPRIWDRYYKSEKAHKRADVGTGLGLSIVKGVMGLHPGGVYGVITSKGEGSTFYIELPKIKESDIE
jgi:signal transduction histidine kinase